VFDLDTSRIIPKFLEWMSRSSDFINICQAASEGTTNRVRLKVDRLLSTEIPLPKKEAQLSIITRIERIAAMIKEALETRELQIVETNRLLADVESRIFNNGLAAEWETKQLDQVAPVKMGQSPPGESYNEQGEGVPLLNGPTEFGEVSPKEIQWTTNPTKTCEKGDILISVRASIGRLNWADKKYCIGRGLAALSPDRNVCVPEYVYYFVETRTQEMRSLSAGSTFLNLPGEKLKRLKIPVPPLHSQQAIVTYLNAISSKFDTLKQLQTDTVAGLKALLPSIVNGTFKLESASTTSAA
jgi:type I restriction enzyme S subunit